ncbi:MAG: hypothetical protein NDJ89_03645 [Oligoflexia bacterium]|nr:hypothetical protein [Oligoflexia bacterium]
MSSINIGEQSSPSRERRKLKSSTLPLPLTIAVDLFGLILTYGPGAIAWTAAVLWLRHFWDSRLLWLAALSSPLLATLVFLLSVFLLRLVVPRLRPGRYPMGANPGMLAWYCHLALSRAALVSGLLNFLTAFYVLKWLHWRALGARVAYGINSSIGVSLVDSPLITIREGATIGDHAHISCHTFTGNLLILKPVDIGPNVFLGMNCVVGFGTRIGEGSWIGFQNRLYNDELPPGTKLENFEWEHGRPKKAPAPKPEPERPPEKT